MGTSLSETRSVNSGSVRPYSTAKMERTVARMPGPNPPIQLLRTIAQTKTGVWKVGACTEVLSMKVMAQATKTRNAAIA
jgi:hypothetical protein